MAKKQSENLVSRALKELGLNQTQLAGKLGVSQGTISNWARDKGAPSEEETTILQELLGERVDTTSFAEWVSHERSRLGITRAALAEKAGVSVPTIYNIESGKITNPQDRTRAAIENALGSDVPKETRKEMREVSEIPGLGDLMDFDPHLEDDRPDVPGVYVFYDISDRPIYVGMGGNISKRVKDHSDKFWFRKPIVEKAAYIRIDDELLRKQVESILIKFLKSNAVINKKEVDR